VRQKCALVDQRRAGRSEFLSACPGGFEMIAFRGDDDELSSSSENYAPVEMTN
jgi:hypothetical protein